MHAVGIKALKNRLSEYVRLAARGERVLVTDRNTVVAELVSPQGTAGMEVSDLVLVDLLRRGLLSAARNPQEPLPAPLSIPGISLLDDLLGERDDR